MSNSLTLPTETIIRHLKLSCQLPTIVESILAHQIILETATELQIEITIEELQTAADRIRLANALHRSEDTLSWLEQHCLSLDDFEEMVRISLLSTKLADHLFSDRIDALFAEQYADYTQAYIYEVIVEDANLAWELFYALQAKETNFFEIAQQYVQDQELRRKGGYRGAVRRTELNPEVCAAIFSAMLPQVLKPVTTAKGVHLIQVEEILLPELNTQLRQQLLSDLFSKWLQQQAQIRRSSPIGFTP